MWVGKVTLKYFLSVTHYKSPSSRSTFLGVESPVLITHSGPWMPGIRELPFSSSLNPSAIIPHQGIKKNKIWEMVVLHKAQDWE